MSSDKAEWLRQTVATMEAPETRYVPVGDTDVAYQMFGDGPIDLLHICGSAPTSISCGTSLGPQRS
jgi:hypothetical protein